jgi:5-methylcytosine-specific restriction enzyme subunit McrC
VIRRTVLKWQRISYGEGEREIPEKAADRLVAVARSSPLGGEGGTRILTHGRRDLRAGQVVGVVAAEGCSLEILPKIEGLGDATGNPSHSSIRRRLVQMLAVALDVEIDSGHVTELGWQRDNLLEVLIGLFTRKLVDAVRIGLPRRYVGHEGDLSALRGRLDVTRQFTTLAATPQTLACRYDDLSPDIALNQIMKSAVKRLTQVAHSSENQRMLRELAFAYADIADVSIPVLRWDQVVLDRTNQRWCELLSLAKLLLGERFQTTTSGAAVGFSLLFEMNTLFEEYVGRMLGRALAKDGLIVQRKGGRLFCLKELDGVANSRFQTIPDILVKRGSEILLVVDTKWKRLSARVDDPKLGIAQADVYQMLAYSRIYRCPRMMLLYPHHAELSGADHFTARYSVTGSDDELAIGTIDVGDAKGMVARLGSLVRRQLARISDAEILLGRC